MTTSAPVRAGELELWVERRGSGPDVLQIAGLGDPAEAWQPQLDGLADRYRVTAFDNRGVGRSPLPDEPLSVATMATTPQRSCAPSTCPPPTSPASRWEARSRRSSRSATRSSSAASCS
jgi:pimeloyl-ACP methyl ester carboxylesterase